MQTFKSRNLEDDEHTRYNPLKGKWILVCPHRAKRPWKGQTEKSSDANLIKCDNNGGLCPNSHRSTGTATPNYDNVYVFDNDFPALRFEDKEYENDDIDEDGLFQAKYVNGLCRVMCYNPKCSSSIGAMNISQVEIIIKEWVNQYKELSAKTNIKWVQIFENRGKEMGCSNPHPHCQIWSSNFIPSDLVTENDNQRTYFDKYHANMLLEYSKKEIIKHLRVLIKSQNWLVVVPFWAEWPFETLVLPYKRHVPRMSDLNEQEILDLSEVLIKLYSGYDKLFSCYFPFSMGWHCAPNSYRKNIDDKALEHWQLHAHFYPPLLRSATVRKFMVGYEMLSCPQRDLTPEYCAIQLLQAFNSS